jgi:hypothetical protein
MQRWLLGAATLTTALGLWVILCLPIGRGFGAIAAVGWCLFGAYQAVDIANLHKRFSRLRIASDGSSEICTTDGQWHAATIGPGCIVLTHLAWLRLRLADGRRYRALLRGEARESKQWRRLQVIWRHLGTTGRSC